MHRLVRLVTIVLAVCILCSATPAAAAPSQGQEGDGTFLVQFEEWFWTWIHEARVAVQVSSASEIPSTPTPAEPVTTETTNTTTPPDDGSTTETHPMGDPNG